MGSEMKNKQTKRIMSPKQELYPQLIYRINSKLSEVKTASDIPGEQIIAPSVFNPFGRNFHWLVVADNKWEFQNGDVDEFSEIKKHIRHKYNVDNWEKFKKNYKASEDKIEFKSIEDAFNILNDATAGDKEYHHALLTVFQFYPVVSHKYIAGIIYRNLERRAKDKDRKLNHKIDHAIADLLISDEKTPQNKKTYILYPWAEVVFVSDDNDKESKWSCQENNSPWYPEGEPDQKPSGVLPVLETKEHYEKNRPEQFKNAPLTPADQIEDDFFYNYFLPFFARYQKFNTTRFLKLEPDHFNQFKHNIVVPLYDAYIDGEYYGNLCGTLQIPFKAEENKTAEFVNNKLEKLKSNSHLLINEIKESAIFEVLQQPISAEADLLEHFIKYITIVQDWERIMVWKHDNAEPELDYCYKRSKGGQSNSKKNAWIKCDAGSNEGCNECKSNFDELKGWIKKEGDKEKEGDKYQPIAEEGLENGNTKSITLFENIFSAKLIPELYPDDETKYKSIRLIFEYPCYTVFPEDEKKYLKLGLHYERQQIDILRQMAMQMKVKRETMKHGTKAAVAAIISRNHSHHIGSHVVPRTDIEKIAIRVKELNCGNYSDDNDARVLKSLYEIVNRLKDRLDKYVQKKADFVAEIATEPLTTTKNVKFFDEVILGFINNVLLMDNIGANEVVNYRGCTNNRLKLYFRVKDKELTAEYKATNCEESFSYQRYPYSTNCLCCCNSELQREKIENGEDVNIAVPGSLGEFAFFAFFENFIRNGIKHNKKSLDDDLSKDFKVYIELKDLDNNEKNEFYKIEVYDNFSDPMNEIVVKGNDGKEKKIFLHEYLQSCVQKSIANNDGSLRKEAWGIAEMKIMATLLRGASDFSNMTESLKVKSEEKPIDGVLKKRLVYELYVMKPKNVALISVEKPVHEHEEAQKTKGIWWFTSLDEYERHILAGKSPASFKFLILAKNLEDAEKKKLKEVKKCLPFRVLVCESLNLKKTIYFNTTIDKKTIEQLKNDKDGSRVLDIVWKTWMNQFISRKCVDNKRPHLVLYFQQNDGEEPTNSWNPFLNDENEFDISICTNKNILGAAINQDDKKSLLVYDRHFDAYYKIQGRNVPNGNIKFHEAFDKNSSDFIHLFSPGSQEMGYELVEAGLLKILVLDERIAEVAHNTLNIDRYATQAYGAKKRIHAARKAGIYICTHVRVDSESPQPLHLLSVGDDPSICVSFKFDNGHDSGEFSIVKTEVYEKGFDGCREVEGIDILIIHQGVLENFLKKYLNDKKDYDAFLESIQRTIPYVVIDSGRGIPAKLPDAAKFLPFSLLEDFLMKDRIAKFSLTKNVMSLIRRKQNE